MDISGTSNQSNSDVISPQSQDEETHTQNMSSNQQISEAFTIEHMERTSIHQHITIQPSSTSGGQPQPQANAVSAGFNQASFTNAPVILGGENININYHQPSHYGDPPISSSDKDQICSKFSECLKAAAKKASGNKNLPIDLDKCIEWVKLQIITDVPQPPDKNLDNLWHFHYRKDRREVLIPSSRTVELKDLFKAAKENSKRKARSSCDNKEAQEEYVLKHGNIVIALGQAGIGKTTLCKLFIKLILDGTLHEENFEYIFYIPFRAVNYKREISFFKFLVRGSSCEWEHTNKSDDILLKELQSNSKVILIMDGLDEATMSTNELSCVHADDESTAENYFKNILTGNLFPAAKKLVTSRPRQFYALDPDYRQQFIVSVVGLNKPAQDELCKQICDPDSKEIIDYLNSHPSLSSHCYVPVNCILTTSCLHNMLKEHGEHRLVTITSVMFYGITQFARSKHFKGNKDNNLKQLQQLAGLAWYGIDCQKIIFDESDFQQLEIEENTRQSFLQTYADSNLQMKIYDGDKKSYFVHLIWQEFFAAIHLMQFMSVDCFEQNASKFSDARFEMVLKFLYGFCNPDLKLGLQKLFPGISGFETKKKILKDLAISSSMESLKSGKVTTLACSWLHESQESEMTTEYINKFPNKLEIQGDIFPSDVECVHYVLRACCKPHMLEVVDSKFVGDCINRFLTMMVKTLELSSYIKLRTVNISYHKVNKDGAQAISCCLNNLEKLILQKCNLTAAAINIISDGIKSLSHKLTKLDVSDNKVNKDGAQAISCCLSNLEKLILKDCNLTAVAINIISDEIKSLSHKIKVLKVSGNQFGDDGARAILSCLNKIEEKLYMEYCGIKEDGVRALIDAINNSPQLLKVFEFSYISSIPNRFGDEVKLPCGLNLLEGIRLRDRGIDSVGIEALSVVITKLPQKMKYLSISDNEMTIDGCVHLASCLNNIDQLEMRECNLDADMIEVLCNAIKHLQNPMKKLNLSGNYMNAQSMAALVSCLANVDRLVLIGITDEEMKCFAHSINDLQISIKCLDISRNKMTIDGCVHLASCLNNIEQLIMSECEMKVEMIEVLCNAIKHLQKPIKVLNVSENQIGDDGARAILSCLNKIEEELYMKDCGIKEDGVIALIDAINNSPQLLRVLKFSYLPSIRNRSGYEDECFGDEVDLPCDLNLLEGIHLSDCGIDSVGIEALSVVIRKLPQKMKYLNISHNKMTIDGCVHLASCLNNIDQLNMRECNLDADMIEVLCNAIKNLRNPMNYLDISGNKMTVDGCVHLASCLNNIDELKMRECNLYADMIEVLCIAIKNLRNPMKWLDLSDNYMDAQSMVALVSCLANVDRLVLRRITDEEMKCFAHSINDLQISMKYLDISGNRMTIDGCVHLASCLNNIEQLKMSNCKMGSKMIEVLCNAIKDLRNPMKCLNISSNRMTIDGYVHLASCLNNIEQLNASYCVMEAEMIEVLCNAIKDLRNPMKYLNISSNEMTIDGCVHLASCLNNIEQLDMHTCEMEAKMIEVLCNAIKGLQNPMQQLNLDENELEEGGTIALSRCLYNINRLILPFKVEKALEEILNAIKQLPRPMKYLELHGEFDEHRMDALCTALHNIEKLDIAYCELTNDDKSRISAALSRLPDPKPVVRMDKSTPRIYEYESYIEDDS